jgi:predicted phosphodiesterase
MKIGLISDTFCSIVNLTLALRTLKREAIHVIIHCGSLDEARIVPFFQGFELHLIQSLHDVEPHEIAMAVRHLGINNTYSPAYRAEIDGVRLVAVHGDDEFAYRVLYASGLYDYVFHGHGHQRKDERNGASRLIHPGGLGEHLPSHSYCILDLKTDQARFIELP